VDGMTLLHRAEEAGLAVKAEGDKLVIRGPKRAEPVARLLLDNKPRILAALAAGTALHTTARHRNAVDRDIWRDRYAARVVHWFHERPWQNAERLAFGEMILQWHRHHGQQPRPDRCAGCGDDLHEDTGLIVDRDGTRVHFDRVRGVDCIIAYGTRWRGNAVAGLQALGLHPPEGFELI
jgi:hypothetical protein